MKFKKKATAAKAVFVQTFDTDGIMVNKSGFKHAPYLVTEVDAFGDSDSIIVNENELRNIYDLEKSIIEFINKELGYESI